MAQVAENIPAKVARGTDQIAGLGFQGQKLGRVEAGAMGKVAIGILAVVGQVITVAEVHAVLLPALLEGLDGVGIRLLQRHIDTLIVLVEQIKRLSGRLSFLLAGNIDGNRCTGTSNRCITCRLRRLSRLRRLRRLRLCFRLRGGRACNRTPR